MNEFAREYLEGASFRLEAAGRQWGILDQGQEFELVYDGKNVGFLYVDRDVSELAAKNFADHAAALVHAGDEKVDEMLAVLGWIRSIKNLRPQLFNWVGVYYRASYLTKENSSDLLLGPFIGKPTSHVRIGLERGLCGLALREERVVNQADVLSDPRHIACSASTRSELVIPLPIGSNGSFIAELDIDSDQIGAFDSVIEQEVMTECLRFPHNLI
jgi:L-methionine (R)-S-oxide reductase